LKKSATYVDIIATIGWNTPTLAVEPSPTISVSKIGNIIFICLTMLDIELPVLFVRLLIIPIIITATAKNPTKPINSPVDFSLNLLLTPFNKFPITPIAIIIESNGKYFKTNSTKLEKMLAITFSYFKAFSPDIIE